MKPQLFKSVCLILFLSGSIELKASMNPSEDMCSLDLGPINVIEYRLDTGDLQPLDGALDTLYFLLRNKKIAKIYEGQYLKVRSGFTVTKGTIQKLYPSYLILDNGNSSYFINYSDASTVKIMNPNKGIRVLGGAVIALAYPVYMFVALAFPGEGLENIEIAVISGVVGGIGFVYSGDRIRGKRIRLKHAKISTKV